MKKTKRCLSLFLIFVFLVNIMCMISVSATTTYVNSDINYSGKQDNLKQDGAGVTGEAVILSIDFTVDSRASQGFALKFFPVNGTTPMGAVRLNQNGLVLAEGSAVSWAATWLEQYENMNNSYAMATYQKDVVNNLKVRLNETKGTIDFYLNDTWIGQRTGTLTGWGGWDRITPAGLEKDIDYLTYEFKSLVTAKSDELWSDVEVDQKNGEISVSFSETVNGSIDSAVLKTVNDEETVALTKKSTSGATTVFTYADELIPGEEYVFVLPENLTGAATGHKLAGRYTYFTAENNIVIDKTYVESDVNYADKQYDLKKDGEGITGEAVILSVDFKVDSRASQGFALRFFPVNGTTPMGAVRLNQNGVVLSETNAVSWAATWLEQYDSTSGYAMATYRKNVVNNLKIRLNETEGTIDFYLNDKWIGQRTGTLTGWGGWDRITPVGLEADKEYFTYEFKSLTVAKSDELLTEVDVDQRNKEIAVSFSEKTTAAIDDVVLKRVNVAEGEEEVTLTKKSTSGATTVFGYTGDLAPGEEYVFVLPAELAGAGTGHKPLSRYVYFTVGRDFTVTSKTAYGFESDADTFAVDIANGNYKTDSEGNVQKHYNAGKVIASGDAAHGNVMQVSNVISHTSDSTGTYGEYNWNGPVGNVDADIAAYSFDFKALKPDLQVAIRIKSPSNKTPFSMAFGKSGYVLGGFNWFDRWSTNVDDITTNSRYSYYIGEYNTTDWINFRMEFDKVNKIARIYMNDKLVSTTTDANYDGVKWASFVLHSAHMTNIAEDEPLFLIDNVQTEVVQRYVNVNGITFTANDGTAYGAYQTMASAPASIALTFNEDVALANSASDKIKLYYGKQEVDYTAAYDKANKKYTMTPASSASAGQKIYVKVDGLTVGEKAVENYTAYAGMSGVEEVTENGLWIVGADGVVTEKLANGSTYYAEFNALNNTGAQQSIMVVIAQYDSTDTMIAVDASNRFTVENGQSVDVDFDSESSIEITPVSGAKKIKVFAWESTGNLDIICGSAELK